MGRVNCDQCSQTFITKKLFVSHLINKSCHKSIREAAKSQSRNKALQEETFDYPTHEIVPFQECDKCRNFSKAGMQMYMLSHLASHVHSKAEYSQCDECGLKFESSNYLEKHKNKKHVNEKCDGCAKKFKSPILLKEHVKDVHEKEKCNKCNFVARTKVDLEQHIYNYHPDDVCEECGMAFENASCVDKHFQEIHQRSKCDENDCDKEFDDDELLDNHKVEMHNATKTTFKQFGGGLMMMMVSEAAEIVTEQVDKSEPPPEVSRINLGHESNLDNRNDVLENIIEEKDDKNIVIDGEEGSCSIDEKQSDVLCESNMEPLVTQNSNISVFGAGFFMLYNETTEATKEKTNDVESSDVDMEHDEEENEIVERIGLEEKWVSRNESFYDVKDSPGNGESQQTSPKTEFMEAVEKLEVNDEDKSMETIVTSVNSKDIIDINEKPALGKILETEVLDAPNEERDV